MVDRPMRPPARAEVADGTGPGVDALVVTGDVVETRDNFKRSMGVLRARFEAIFYVPGSHDLWLRRESGCYVSGFSPLPSLLCNCKQGV